MKVSLLFVTSSAVAAVSIALLLCGLSGPARQHERPNPRTLCPRGHREASKAQ